MNKYKDLRITSPFGLRELRGESEYHVGVDYGFDDKLHVWAGFSSLVNRISEGEREGFFVQLKTKLNEVMFYINIFHLQEKPNWLQRNMFLRPDDIVGIAGSSGNSTGIHAHYEIFTYQLDKKFIKSLKHNMNSYVAKERKPRIYFDPMQLFNYCKNSDIYI
jgi:hypothetical protein